MKIQKKKSKGQIIPLGIFCLSLVTLMIIILYNTGQTQHEKIHAANIADAAAYSGLTFQGRSLNYIAYTNRAMIANQVSIGQIVSLSSWLEYSSEVNESIEFVLRLIPHPAAQNAARVFKSIAKVLDTIELTLGPIITLVNGFNVMTHASQKIVANSTALETPLVINHVITSFDPRYSLSNVGKVWVGVNAYDWLQFIQYSDSLDDIKMKAELIRASQDPWINRRYNKSLETPDLGPAVPQLWFQKDGMTQLIYDNGWKWEAREGGSVFVEWLDFSWTGIRRKKREVFPAGYANKILKEDNPVSYPSEQDDAFGTNNQDNSIYFDQDEYWLTTKRAESWGLADPDEINAYYSGVQGLYQLENKSTAQKDNELALAIEVDLKKDQLPIRSELLDSNNSTETQKPKLSAISQARLFFQRPDTRQDGRIEYANLFNPYWQVRLTSPDSKRSAAWLGKGLSL